MKKKFEKALYKSKSLWYNMCVCVSSAFGFETV